MGTSDQLTYQLHIQGYRLTPQRLAVLRILQEAGSHLSPSEIFARAREVIPGITEATIYRTLNFLTGQGLTLVTHIGMGQLVYEASHHNHHHLVCRSCGRSMEIGHEALDSLYQHFEASTGFEIDTVHLTFLGLCPECKNKNHK